MLAADGGYETWITITGRGMPLSIPTATTQSQKAVGSATAGAGKSSNAQAAARAAYEEGMRVMPRSVFYPYLDVWWNRELLPRFEAALQYFEKALKSNPRYASALGMAAYDFTQKCSSDYVWDKLTGRR